MKSEIKNFLINHQSLITALVFIFWGICMLIFIRNTWVYSFSEALKLEKMKYPMILIFLVSALLALKQYATSSVKR